MSLKKERFIKGIILAPDTLSLDGIEGEIKVDSSTGKIQVTLKDGANPSASREILTSSQTQTLTNKTLTSPVIDTGVSGTAIETDLSVSASATKLASASAIKTYVDNVAAAQNEASEISYSNATSGLTATNIQNAIDEVDGNVDNLVSLSGVALDSITLGTFTGVTIPDSSTVKSALQAIETSHESHTGASSGVHGVAGSVVGTSDSQALTNKTIDADLNTISNIENADIKVGANIARSKLASGTANRVVVNDATGVQTDAAAITAARVLISDANGIPTHSSVTSTTLGYVDATSSIQNQLDAKVDESGGTLTNGSVITPARLDVKQNTKANLTTYALTAANGQLCFATDTKEMFQIVDGLLESVGGGAGIGGVDILFSQTFEEAALTDFTQTGLSLSTSSPLHGEISALLTHDSSINQLFKQIIPVDIKFRGQTMVLRLDSKSSASQGNVVINIYDETNSANLVASEQLQLSNDVNGKRTSVSFTIPETCASLSYTITALPEAGSPTTRIDDIICELAETALLETAVEVPVVTAWQGYTPTFQGFGTPTNIEFEYRQVGENVEIRGKFTVGTPTAVEARVGLPAGLTSAGTSLIPSIQVIGKGNVNASSTTQFSGRTVIIEPNVSYVTFGAESSIDNGITKALASSFVGSGNTLSFFASVPCAGLSALSTKTIALTQSGLVQEGDSYVRVTGSAGLASTNTKIVRFSNIRENIGSDILYQQSATLGDSFTVLTSGIYGISAVLSTNGASFEGISKNSSQLSTDISGINEADRIALGYNSTTGEAVSLSAEVYLNAGDVIRAHAGANFNAAGASFQITKQGSLKQVSVNPNSKITIPTSELRFEGASARGSTDTAIVRFDTIAKIRGDAFTVESDSVLGTRITMKKAGKLDVQATVTVGASFTFGISKNQTIRTSTPTVAECIAIQSNASTFNSSVAGSTYVQVGDIIRVSASGNPSGSNFLTLAFQEQDISVSVTNTLPQFSESDSCVRVTGGNGFTGQTRLFSNVIQNIGSDVQYTAASGQFRAMSSGIYNITYQEETAVSTNGPEIYIYVNETLTAIANDRINTAASLTRYPLASIQLYLSEGDIITGRVIATATFPSVSSYSSMTISKVGKPNVTGVDVTPFVNVPQPDNQTSRMFNVNSITAGNYITGSLTNSVGTGIYSYDSSTGYYTILKKCIVTMSYSARSSSTTAARVMVLVDGSAISLSHTAAALNIYATATTTVALNPGQILAAYVDTAATNNHYVNVSAEASSDQILTAPETFSTDTASLTYANMATYTPSTLANAPVGTYITFTYAGGGNARSQTTGLNRPTQTDADMNANGILLYTRVFSVGSSSSQPAAIAIQIGKGMKGKTIDLYKSAGKLISGSIDSIHVGTDTQRGLAFQSYDEKTGILYLDAGLNLNGSATTDNKFIFNDNLTQTSGYLVINASKNPALTGLNVLLPRIATLSDVKASGTEGGTATSGAYQTRILNTISDPTGVVTSLASNQFILTAGEYYIEASAPTRAVNNNKIKIRNITDSTDAIIGSNAFAGTNGSSSVALGNIVITSSKTFELQHRVQTTAATNGFGSAAAFGENEVYSIVKITKVK